MHCMPVRGMTRCLVLTITLSVRGCHSTRVVSPQTFSQRAGLPSASKGFAIKGDGSRHVRITAASVRVSIGNKSTRWIKAGQIRLNQTSITLGELGSFKWRDLDDVEVRNRSAGRTAIALIGAAAATVIVSPVVLAAATLTRSGRVAKNLFGAVIGGVIRAADDPGRKAPLLEPEPTKPKPTKPKRSPPDAPLFTRNARRRSVVKVGAGVWFGNHLARPRSEFSGSLRVGVRLMDLIDLGVGLEHLAIRRAAPDYRSTWLGFATLGVHLDFDSQRRFGLALGSEVGGSGYVRMQWRAVWGIRLRIRDELRFGIYPFTPTYRRFGDPDNSGQPQSHWRFPSYLELSYHY
jgi:hypothetical protein